MKYKKLVVLLFFAMILSGCGKNSENNDVEGTVAVEVVTTIEETTEATTEAATELTTEESLDVVPEEYAYVLTVTINPEVKLYLDKDDSIVGIAYLNKDAEDAYSELKLVGSKMDEGFEMMIDAAIDKNYLQEGMPVSVELSEVKDTEVVADNSKLQEVKSNVSDYICQKENFVWQSTVEIEVAKEVTQNTGIEAIKNCDDCNGTGNDCDECKGTGIVHCKRCNNGYETCGTCNGSGIQTCNGCHGSGSDMGATCNYCGGSGTYACETCGGAGGYSDCSWCHGALQHICPICWNEGVCATCGGTGLQ